MVAILSMSTITATLDFLKIKLFWNNGYDVIIPVHNVTNKIFSCDWIFNADVVTQIKVLEKTEVITTSIWYGFDHTSQFFCGVLLFQVKWFETGIRYDLEIFYQCGKSMKLKVIKAKSVKVTGEELVGGLLAPTTISRANRKPYVYLYTSLSQLSCLFGLCVYCCIMQFYITSNHINTYAYWKIYFLIMHALKRALIPVSINTNKMFSIYEYFEFVRKDWTTYYTLSCLNLRSKN